MSNMKYQTLYNAVIIGLVLSIVVNIGFRVYAEDEPNCGFLCGLCPPPLVIKLERWAKITSVDIMPYSWATCEGAGNCCSAEYVCELYVGQKVVSVGGWVCEPGISFGIDLPVGLTLEADGKVSINGETTVTVEAGIKGQCKLSKCQTSTLRVGPYYKLITREVQCYKMCFNPTEIYNFCTTVTPCSELMGFKKISYLLYLISACKVTGECGIPYYGSATCPQCADPYNPLCN